MILMKTSPEVVVVGAGLAGLRCAVLLHQHGIEVLLLESQDQVGGRVRTDVINGFRLDRGFQVLQTAYPAAQRAFDYATLNLQPFPAGAYVFTQGRFQPLFDPLRHPDRLWSTLRSGLLSARDLLAMLKLNRRLDEFDLEANPELTAPQSTRAALYELGFSESLIQRFWRPFLSGVFLETSLETRAAKFFFVMKAFREGIAALPAEGMQALPTQLARQLPPESIRTQCAAMQVEANGRLHLQDGTTLTPRFTVLAVDAAALDQLWPGHGISLQWNCGTTVYFASETTSLEAPEALLLEGEPNAGPVATAVALHIVAPSYVPSGAFLLTASMPGFLPEQPEQAYQAARFQLRRWFGSVVDLWQPLGCYPIVHALPAEPSNWQPPQRKQLSDRVLLCGDYFGLSSIQYALAQGERVAEHILQQFYG